MYSLVEVMKNQTYICNPYSYQETDHYQHRIASKVSSWFWLEVAHLTANAEQW